MTGKSRRAGQLATSEAEIAFWAFRSPAERSVLWELKNACYGREVENQVVGYSHWGTVRVGYLRGGGLDGPRGMYLRRLLFPCSWWISSIGTHTIYSIGWKQTYQKWAVQTIGEASMAICIQYAFFLCVPFCLLTFVLLWFALGRSLFLFQSLGLGMLSPPAQLKVDEFPHHEGLSEADPGQDGYPCKKRKHTVKHSYGKWAKRCVTQWHL